MRTEQEVLKQLLDFARQHDDIHAVTMNGSRVNPNAPKDPFNDYDVVYFVDDPRPYKKNQSWISYFGELIIVQQNDFSHQGLAEYIFLMVFTDGVRIDLSFCHLSRLAYLQEDSLTRVLLDKDGRIPPLPASSDCGYRVGKPRRKVFDATTNEIVFCTNNIAKGIWRDELPYAKMMMETIWRPCLLRLLSWYASSLHGWQLSTGYMGKWLKRCLPPEVWEAYRKTYPGEDYEQIWEALFAALRLAQQIGVELADELGYAYPVKEQEAMTVYLEQVRRMPIQH